MSTQGHHSSIDSLERATNAVTGVWHALAQPERARRVRQAVTLLLLVWAILALTDLIWAFLPRPEVNIPIELNPLESRSGGRITEPVDVGTMLSWHLFGVVGEEATADPLVPAAVTLGDREGIEKGARDTRLDLTLRGVIAATEDGLGHAIIEHRSQQDVYAVGDKLPVDSEANPAKPPWPRPCFSKEAPWIVEVR